MAILRQTEFYIGDNIADVWEFLAVFPAFARMKVVNRDRGAMCIYLNAPVNLNTMGENVEIHLTAAGKDNTKITVISRSKLRTAVMDMGKNSKNVRLVQEFILDQCE